MFKNTNVRPPMSKRDKQVETRNAILSLVDKGCEELNKSRREFLANTLKTVHNETRGEFIVDTKPEGKYEFFNVDYTAQDGIILIKEVEGDTELIMVLKLKDGQCKGEWRAYELNLDYFRYDADLEAEAQ
jgi:hypothetical protein